LCDSVVFLQVHNWSVVHCFARIGLHVLTSVWRYDGWYGLQNDLLQHLLETIRYVSVFVLYAAVLSVILWRP